MNQLVIHQRGSSDDFTYELFIRLYGLNDIDGLFIYTHHWSIQFARQEILDLVANSSHSIIVLGIKDHYISEMETFLSDLGVLNPTKKFIIIVSPENLKNTIINSNLNILDVLCWGGDWTNQINFYQTETVPIHKQFDNYTFTCHMRNQTKDRVVLLDLIFGLELDQMGLITANHWFNSGTGSYTCDYFTSIYNRNEKIYPILLNGSLRAKDVKPNLPFNPDFTNDVLVAGNPPLNFKNFKKYLRPNFNRAPIDIVAESEWINDSPFFTEKTLHCFYAKSLPIIISGKGAIKHLRMVGFDVFDDIINHSYDEVDDRLERIYSALANNANLLKNKELIYEKYYSVAAERFESNINVIKNTLCNFYEQRLVDDYTKVIEQYIGRK